MSHENLLLTVNSFVKIQVWRSSFICFHRDKTTEKAHKTNEYTIPITFYVVSQQQNHIKNHCYTRNSQTLYK
jgi:hypothetical protein